MAVLQSRSAASCRWTESSQIVDLNPGLGD